MPDAFTNPNDAPKSATETLDARQWLVPGWYWAFLDPGWEDSAGWTDFTHKNPSIHTQKTVGSLEKGSWVLFQVQGKQPVIWTLPGYPTKALKGAATEVQDVLDQSQNEPATANQLSDFLAGVGKQLGSAGQVLLWGGVAIVLWQIFQATGGSAARGRGSAREEREEYEEETITRRSSSPRTHSGTLVSRYR